MSDEQPAPPLACKRIEDGVEVPLRIKPGAKRNAILGKYGDRLKIAIAAAPEDGKANKALRRYVAQLLGLRLEDVRLLRGAASRDKTIAVRGATPRDIQALLSEPS